MTAEGRIKSFNHTALGELKTIFEFELFGTRVDAGQTTLRLRHASGELGKFGVGQYWSRISMYSQILWNTGDLGCQYLYESMQEVYHIYGPLWKLVTPEAREKILKTDY